MFAQHMLFAALAATPPAERTSEDFESQVDQVEFVGSDSDGEVIGTIALWVERDGQIFLASDYGDGYAETVVTDGRARTEATLAPEVIERRAGAMLLELDYAGRDPGPQEGWAACAITTVGAVAACAGGVAAGGVAIAACPAGAAWAACECLPVLVDKWRDKEC